MNATPKEEATLFKMEPCILCGSPYVFSSWVRSWCCPQCHRHLLSESTWKESVAKKA